MAMPHLRPSIQGYSAKERTFDISSAEIPHGSQVRRMQPSVRTDWASWESLLSALTGRDIAHVLRCWQKELNSSAADGIVPMLDNLQSAIQEGIFLTKLMLSADSIPKGHQTDALLSVCLIETLQEVITSLCSTHKIASSYIFSGWHSLELRHLEHQMAASGWCPNHVQMCRKVFGLATLIFSSTISRPFQRTHPECSKLQCVAYKVEERSVTKYRFEGCCCHFAGSPEEDLRGLVALGAIPLVRIDWAHRVGPVVNIVPFDGKTSFVAEVGTTILLPDFGPYCYIVRLESPHCCIASWQYLYCCIVIYCNMPRLLENREIRFFFLIGI